MRGSTISSGGPPLSRRETTSVSGFGAHNRALRPGYTVTVPEAMPIFTVGSIDHRQALVLLKCYELRPMSSQTRAAISTTFHRSLQVACKFLGGRYGQRPEPLIEPQQSEFDIGPIKLKALTWQGPQPAMVLLHGLNNNAWSWARVASELSTHRNVIAICQRGHGGSTAPSCGYHLATSSNDLRDVLDHLGLPRVDLAGHSWGGKVATYFAATNPDRVTSLILADPVLPKGLNPIIRSSPTLTTASLRAERGPFPSHQAWVAGGRSVAYLHHWDQLDQKLWAAGFERQADGSYHHRLPESAFDEILSRALAENIESLLPAIECPVLFLRPTFTISFVPGETAFMQRALPQMQQQRIAGDHTFIHTNALDTSEAIKRFLR